MPYEHKPGSFTLFKNTHKTADNQPDYRGEGKALDGTSIEIAGWIKKSEKGSFLSCKMQEPREGKPSSARSASKDDDESPPF